MTRTLSKRRLALVVGLAILSFLFLGLRYTVPTDPGRMELDPSGTGQQLVVIIQGLGGKKLIQGLNELARETFPDADYLTTTYEPTPFTNIDPYRLANIIEIGIHDAHTKRGYENIILVGHSMGAMLLRKALVWGYGIEDDRTHLGLKGRRDWVNHVDRLVSIAGINRGWSINPKPKDMTIGRYLTFSLGEKFASLTGTGQLLLGMRRGSPFIADLRVQWIRLARDPDAGPEGRTLPFVVHLLGDRDDIVAREDAQDLAAAKDTRFMTIPNLDHGTIVSRLSVSDPADQEAAALRDTVRSAMADAPHSIPLDVPEEFAEDLTVRRIVYILHGIRDYGVWGERIRQEIEARAPRDQTGLAVVPAKYGYFPMAPFLLYWDRQKNVRIFMDEYTENLAKFPYATTFDYVGHSNGTYILASALQRYKTLNIRNVYFAGSVVPKHYPWIDLIEAGRVEQVRNVVASDDWVVALFPRFFEQIADWLGVQPTTGVLDIGSAGFRGFQEGSDALGRVRDVKFAVGGHGSGVDVSDPDKLQAIVNYAVDGSDGTLAVFAKTPSEVGLLDVLSNISWIVWVFLALVLVAFGILANGFGWIGLSVYGVVVVGILYSL